MLETAEILLEAHQSLVTRVTGNMRCVTFEMEGERCALYHAFTYGTPTDDDREFISDAAAEFCSKFPHLITFTMSVVQSDAFFHELPKLRYWLFVRAEEFAEHA